MKDIRPFFVKKLCWKSPLECLQLCYVEQAQFLSEVTAFELRVLYIVSSWWKDSTIHIDSNADEAVHRHNINKLCWDQGMLDIYMNGSSINDQVEAAAVALEKGLGHMTYIDINETSTVYVAELQSLVMTTDIAKVVKTEEPELWTVNIYTDN